MVNKNDSIRYTNRGYRMKITTIFTLVTGMTSLVMAGNIFKEIKISLKNKEISAIQRPLKPDFRPRPISMRVHRGVLKALPYNGPRTAKPAPKISVAWEKMVDGVKHFEGFRAKPYRCCGGKMTIGYGHTGSYVKKGYITEEQAEKLLVEELEKYKNKVLDIVKVPLTDAQLAALTSFTYNCGEGALRKLVNQPGRLNDGNYDSIERIMPLYRRAGGEVKDGLVRRRAWELEIWNT